MKQIIGCLLLLLSLTVLGCGDPAKEWFETAQLEELQNSHDHACKLYKRILEKYPESEYAPKAEERLAAINSQRKQ